MLLAQSDVSRFLDTYKKVLETIVSGDDSADSKHLSGFGLYARGRKLLGLDRGRMETAITSLRARGEPLDGEVLEAVRTMRIERWSYLKNYTGGAAFLDTKERAYLVLALNDRLDGIIGPSGCLITTGVLRFAGYYVCDGLIIREADLGPNYRKSFNATLAGLRREKRLRTRPGTEILAHDHPEW